MNPPILMAARGKVFFGKWVKKTLHIRGEVISGLMGWRLSHQRIPFFVGAPADSASAEWIFIHLRTHNPRVIKTGDYIYRGTCKESMNIKRLAINWMMVRKSLHRKLLEITKHGFESGCFGFQDPRWEHLPVWQENRCLIRGGRKKHEPDFSLEKNHGKSAGSASWADAANPAVRGLSCWAFVILSFTAFGGMRL